ncbi:MAG: extracellular solute-binding protein [Ornithinimicrobium sp.]|uniref:extracellular solute-binding protein n=1 Tax=Ornithinimicrobium sp. TaxID=1977084 RepID=UPI003D9AC45C
MRRTQMLIALTAGAAVTLAGCGRESESSGSGESAPQTGEAVSTEDVGGTIDVWAMGAEGEKLPDLAKDFEAAHDGVTVNVTAIPWDSAHDKFVTSITAGTTPDLAMVGTTWMGEFAGLDALDPAPGSIDSSVFFEGAQSTTEVDGTAYGVPWYVETRLVYYRTDLAEKAGHSEVPTDWAGFHQMATDLQAKGGSEWGISLQPGGTGSWQTVLPFAWTNGAEVSADDQYTFDTPAMTEAVDYYQSFFTDGLANPKPVADELIANFVNGDEPMFISGPWMRSLVEDTGGEGFAEKYDVAPIPMPEGGSSSSFVGGSNLAVFQSTDNRDTAWAFVQWLTEPETQVSWYEMTTDLPSVQSAWDADALTSDPKLAAFGTQLETAQAPPSFATWEEVVTAFDTAIEQVTKAEKDPAAALQDVQSQAESIGTE